MHRQRAAWTDEVARRFLGPAHLMSRPALLRVLDTGTLWSDGVMSFLPGKPARLWVTVEDAVVAARLGYTQLFAERGERLPVVSRVLREAAVAGQLELLVWLLDRHPLVCLPSDTLDSAAAEGHVHIIQWLHRERRRREALWRRSGFLANEVQTPASPLESAAELISRVTNGQIREDQALHLLMQRRAARLSDRQLARQRWLQLANTRLSIRTAAAAAERGQTECVVWAAARLGSDMAPLPVLCAAIRAGKTRTSLFVLCKYARRFSRDELAIAWSEARRHDIPAVSRKVLALLLERAAAESSRARSMSLRGPSSPLAGLRAPPPSPGSQ